MYYCGIDYHKKYSVASVMNAENKIVQEERLEHHQGSKAFERFFDRLDGSVQVVYESSQNWCWLHEILERLPRIEKITMANPYQTRIIATAQIKTDKLDARKLAMLLKADLIPAVHIPNQKTRARKEVLRQRTFWVKQRTRVRNRIHRIIGRQHEVQMPRVTDLFGAKGRVALNKAMLPEPDEQLLRQNLKVLDALSEQIRQAEQSIEQESQVDPKG